MRHWLLYILLVLSVVVPRSAAASEGHAVSGGGADFYIDDVHVTLRLDPPHFTKGVMPRVVVDMADRTGGPVLDAVLLAAIQQAAGQAAGHEGHDMNSMAASAPSGEGGLDFGSAGANAGGPDLSTFLRLEPQQKAGSYAAQFHVHAPGRYLVRLAVTSMGGRKSSAPLTYGWEFSYLPESRAPLYRMMAVLSVIVLSGLLAVVILRQRRTLGLNPGETMNLLDIPWLRNFLKSAWFQPVFQVPALIIFLVIMAAGLFDVQQGDRNIATLLMWTIWWAAIIFTFVLVGRVWCMMCPFGAIQDWVGRLRSMNRDFPRPLRNIYLSSFIFFGLTWWDSYSGIVNRPALTAYLLLGFFAVAIGMALVFRGRAFCRYVCPIGGLIGIYSMFSPLELRSKCLEVCRGHKVKECIKGTEKSHGCPMFVTPLTLDRNNYCNFCSECIKSCSQDNIVIRFRSFAKDLWVSSKGYLDESLFVMALVGISMIVTGEMIEPWHGWMDNVEKVIPFDSLGIISHAAREKATFLLVFSLGSLAVAPGMLLLSSLAVRRLTAPESPLPLRNTFVQFAYMFIPVGLAMHLAHNVSHLFTEGPAVVPAFGRLLGVLGFSVGEPDWNVTPVAGSETIFWLQMAIFLVMNIFSLYAGYRIAVKHYGDKAHRAFIPMALLAVSLMVLNAYILGQPMALRHHH